MSKYKRNIKLRYDLFMIVFRCRKRLFKVGIAAALVKLAGKIDEDFVEKFAFAYVEAKTYNEAHYE